MATEIVIDDQNVLKTIDDALADPPKATYSDAYRAIADFLAQKGYPEDDPLRKWFEEAAHINAMDPCSAASNYINQVTAAGLEYEGIQPPYNLQAISDAIAQNVLQEIRTAGGIPPIDEIISKDIAAALTVNGVTPGGWGGAFYYFDADLIHPDTGELTTVGDYILTTPGELEKFIALNAEAAVVAAAGEVGQLAIDPFLVELENILSTMLNAQVPQEIKEEIAQRATGVALNNFSGDPDVVFDPNTGIDWEYDPIGDVWFNQAATGQVADATTDEWLDAMRNERLTHPYQSVTTSELLDLLRDHLLCDLSQRDYLPADARFYSPPPTPLVIDLDGDGVELISLENSSAYFDIDNDGISERVAWVQADDGLLAFDLNGDGFINDRSELFGSATGNGFTSLATLDANADGVVDALDVEFANLVVWRDANGNGFSEAAELASLSDVGIVSIDLNATALSGVENAGNTVSHRSSVTWSDGSTTDIDDVWFDVNQRDSILNLTYDIPIQLEDFLFPLLYGSGDVVDSYFAYAQDPTLKDDARALLETLAAGDVRGFLPEFESFLLKWAGADAIDPASRGGNIDARHLVFLENLYGASFRQFTLDFTEPDFQSTGWLGGYTGRPNAEAAAGLEELYRELVDRYALLFMVQSGISYAALYTESLDYSTHPLAPLADMSFLGGATFLGGDFAAIATQIIDRTAAGALDPINAALVIDLLTFDLLGAGGDVEAAFADVVASYAGDRAAATAILEALPFVDPTLANVRAGTSADDAISDGIGSSLLYGGAGNDSLSGGRGHDTFLYVAGDGSDVITEFDNWHDGVDRLLLLGFDPAAVTLSHQYVSADQIDLVISLPDGETVTIAGQFKGALTADPIEWISFDNGVSWDPDALFLRYQADAHAAGATTIYGLQNADDTFVHRATFGSYTISGAFGEDRLVLEDALSGDVHWELNQSTGDLTLTLASGEQITVLAQVSSLWSGGLNEIQFADGEIWDRAQINGAGFAQLIDDGVKVIVGSLRDDYIVVPDGSAGYAETSGNGPSAFNLAVYADTGDDYVEGGFGVDRFFGRAGDDTLIGHGGDDYLVGDEGADSLYGGDGADELEGDEGNDRLEGGAGNDVLVGGTGNDILDGGAGGDSLDGGDGSDWASYASATGGVEVGVAGGKKSGDAKGDSFTSIENLIGSAYDDKLSGDAGGNAIAGGEGADIIDGKGGRDIIWYGYATAAVSIDLGLGIGLTGEAAGDTYANMESVQGSDFDDTFYGSGGYDEMFGGAGDDLFQTRGGDDVVVGEEGYDTIDFSWASTGAEIRLDQVITLDWYGTPTNANYAYVGSDTVYLFEMERIIGTDFGDVIGGSSADNWLYGEGGNDSVFGYDGNDWLRGGDGDDLLVGGWGGDGVDYIEATSGVFYTLSDTTPFVQNGNTFAANYATFASGEIDYIFEMEHARGTNFADTLIGSGANNWLAGADGDDLIEGRNGYDDLYGGTGNDTLEGGADGDELYGEDGSDYLHGGDGDDLHYGGAGDDYFLGSAGLDHFYGGDGVDTLDMSYTSSSFNAWLEDGYVEFHNSAQREDATAIENLIGSTGGDALFGSAVANRLEGRDGNDFLDGGAGDDSLFGEAGSDELVGRDGNDDLWGGTSTDAFVFGLGDGIDTIHDFEDGLDLIQFVGGLSFGDLAIADEAEGARISYGASDSVLVANVLAADLTADDFVFA